jgi:hypothetical protein
VPDLRAKPSKESKRREVKAVTMRWKGGREGREGGSPGNE